jgi:uncharacterized peroxidase-related enzyme
MLIHPRGGEEASLAAWYEGETVKWGYRPNYAEAFASRPSVAAAWSALNGAVREGMDRRRYELVTIAAAQALRSTYCAVAHSKFLRDACGDESTMRSIAAEPDSAELDDTDRALVAFARKVTRDAAGVDERDIEALRVVGMSDNDIADVVFAVAARCFFATVLDAVGAEADHQLRAALPADVAAQLALGRPIAEPPAA